MRKFPIDTIAEPFSRFINNSTTSGLVLFVSALTALIMANSPWSEAYHHIWEHKLSVGYDEYVISKSLHHWINDGLMAIFFFVIGLELKREVIAGELSNVRDAIFPLVAGIGGMVVPALIFAVMNSGGAQANGWGIPMATDIAFALGILYMLGPRVPVALKVFLTALAIADDLGAVLVIAFFYTSDISFGSLAIGLSFLVILIVANVLGVRNVVFYGIIGIGGVWLAFLLSGIHATIAGVLAALTIPANVKISDRNFALEVRKLTKAYEEAETNDVSLVTKEQLHILEKIRYYSKAALPPLQRLEHSMHPLVAYVVIPVFALANAGIHILGEGQFSFGNSVTLGIILGLVAGKFAGIAGFAKLAVGLKLASLPEGVTWRHIYGVALLAGVGFTMSLFITELAYTDQGLILQAKTGILIASLVSGLSGYLLLKNVLRK